MLLTLLPHSQQLLAIRAWGARRVSEVSDEVNGLRHIVMVEGMQLKKQESQVPACKSKQGGITIAYNFVGLRVVIGAI